jgi:hypothetical protein
VSATVVLVKRPGDDDAARLFDEVARWADRTAKVQIETVHERTLIVTMYGSVDHAGLRRRVEEVMTANDPDWQLHVRPWEMARPKRVVLMCDYTADPLWSGEGGEMLPLEYVPLTDETKTALRRWADEWEALRPTYEPPPSDDPRMLAHEGEGIRLWKLVREELGPDYLVGFREWADPEGRPRTAWSPEEAEAAPDR